ncbi:PEP-CTERM sorting domain-containing protein [Gloeothece verrucosa]|uniref:Lipolytic protein G-D-S-L family n=1 Tax=Gloeothece verrucosa (strain PCC 7822) TaxID=497965 RepID=E0UE06_GLOV7|nr:PEP-CTERM sorting domain-containing protein [Gloeothece verrucosa]ADN13010.1 lipolytic protein G-D-S-L family [Gloeothece verrucosa PCC 7822]
MKRLLLNIAVLATPLILPSQATAAVFSKIYSFGDSLSDTGKVFTASKGSFPPSAPNGHYYQGRFSNGPVWVEYLQNKLKIPLVNFAYGGATTGKGNIASGFIRGVLGLQQQIATFVASNAVADPKALYTIWIGANDYLPPPSNLYLSFNQNTPDIPLNNIATAVNTLVGKGAKTIMVLNLPNLGTIPQTKSLNADGVCPPNIEAAADADCLNQLTEAHNKGLSNLFSSLRADVKIIQVDVNQMSKNILSNPAEYGFTNVTDPCFTSNSICSNPDNYLSWDGTHPTTKGHRLIGESAFNALAVPEPLTILGTSTALFFGAFFKKEIVQQRQQNKSN